MDFQPAHRIGLLILSVILLLAVLEIVRRGRLKEKYALLWLAAATAGLVVGIFPAIVDKLAETLHVQYLTVFFGLSFLFLLGIVLSFTIVISRLSEQTRELAQELALLNHKLESRRKQSRDDG